MATARSVLNPTDDPLYELLEEGFDRDVGIMARSYCRLCADTSTPLN